MIDLPTLDALRANEQSAWDQLYECLDPIAKEVVQARLGGIVPQDVEDVSMLACQAAIPHVHKIKTVEELRPLVALIARNKALDRLRRYYGPEGGKRTRALTDDDDPPPPDGGSQDPIEEAHLSDLAKVLLSLINRLPPKARNVLNDSFYRGKSYRQIAESHGLSEESVGNTIYRALGGLHTEIKKIPGLENEIRDMLGPTQTVRGILGQVNSMMNVLLVAFL